MLKAAAVIAVPWALGGASLLFAPEWPESGSDVYRETYVVEVGVAFREEAVRAALPAGLEPAPGFTGGIAIYSGDKGWALSPLSTGYVWIDLTSPEGASGPTRFMLQGFASERYDGASPIPADVTTLGEMHEIEADGTLHAVAWPDRGSVLDLSVRINTEGCAEGLSPAQSGLLAPGPDGTLGVIHMPMVLDLCKAEALSARVEAPAGHVLDAFAPERVLWAGVATPLRWAMPDL